MKLTITIWFTVTMLLAATCFYAGKRSVTEEEVYRAGYHAGVGAVARGETPVPPPPIDLEQARKTFAAGKREAMQEIAACTLERARRDECYIPCANDDDCLAKNGQMDH